MPTAAEIGKALDASLSANTLKSYAVGLRVWTRWAKAHRSEPMPATADAVADYLLHARASAPVLARTVAALSHAHRAAGLATPTKDPRVRDLLRAAARRHDAEPRAPILLADLRRIVAALPATGLRSARDRAILLLGWWGALRESEIVGLRVEWISRTPNGLALTFPRGETKTAKTKADAAAVPRRDGDLDPVRALDAWLAEAKVKSGAVFRAVADGRSRGGGLTPDAVRHVVKRAAAAAGLDTRLLGGHSLRAGFVTEALNQGIPPARVMATTRHRSVAMLVRYYRPGPLEAGAGAMIKG